jgi:copper homeostasis protein
VDSCKRLVDASRPFKAVFHRAFDEIVGYGGPKAGESALEDLAKCGIDGVLTSGGPGSAAHNTATLVKIMEKAAGVDIQVIIGGGVRKSNTAGLVQALSLKNVKPDTVLLHSSCLATAPMDDVDPAEVEGILAHLR